MFSLDIKTNLAEFNASLARYQKLSGKAPEEVLQKQGGKLAWNLHTGLREIMPRKGEVTQERLAALRAGEGLRIGPKVRERVIRKLGVASSLSTRRLGFVRKRRGKSEVVGSRLRRGRRVNLQAEMVRAELASRESARGFLSISARYPRRLRRSQRALSKYGPILSDAGITLEAKGARARFLWSPSLGDLSQEAAHGLSRPRGRALIARSLHLTNEDIKLYLRRKLSQLRDA